MRSNLFVDIMNMLLFVLLGTLIWTGSPHSYIATIMVRVDANRKVLLPSSGQAR